MHMAGHVDKWCMKNSNPRNVAELNDVSTGIWAARLSHGCQSIQKLPEK